MQPVKLTILGKYWDSQIYAGKLYLFNLEGDIQTVRWDRLIEDVNVKGELKLALSCAFTQSSLLYGDGSQPFVSDIEIKEVIRKKFELLLLENINIDQKIKFENLNYKSKQQSPFPFPHTDSCIYGKKMFIGSREGLFQASCDGKTTYAVSTRVTKGWDSAISSLSASYRSLAIAAGPEGLFEKSLDDGSLSFAKKESSLLMKGNFTSCNWLYYSIYGSSNVEGGKLADFKQVDDEDISEDELFKTIYSSRGNSKKRKLNKVFTDKKLFLNSGSGYSWGNQDKIFIANDNQISILKYKPWDHENKFTALNTLNLHAWKGQVISAATALFGTVIECENAIVVLPTEGDPITIPGEPINWRIFTRSKNYENQLHIIYDDRLEIYSFNHDYFVDQDEKVLGIRRPSTFRSRYR